ncbi:MAG TPA: SusC/RagA family TonB-linked outer membrane protein [Gemmatimonadaceae bacterium]
MTRTLPAAVRIRGGGLRRFGWCVAGTVSVVVSAATACAQTAAAAPTQGTTAPAATAMPRDVPPLKRLVTLEVRDVPLAAALRMIDRQADLGLAFTNEVVPSGRRVSLSVSAMPAGEALKRALRGTGIVVKVTSSGQILLVKGEGDRRAEASDTVKVGAVVVYVVDSTSNEPLAGAVVSVEGTTIGGTTSLRGFALLRGVPVGLATITARYLGYAPAERDVAVLDSQSVRVTIALHMGMSRLQQVVTTATGGKRRLEVGNDITVIDADSITATQPITSVTDLLEGRVPGLVVQRTSGAPGDPSRLRLRGASSAYLSNDPIVIVDGVRIYAAQSDARSQNLVASFAAPSPIDQIDPNSIQTIEVLKGPSASTMYGADAANGVIVITTKKGRAGPPRWTASLDRGTTYMPGSYPAAYLRWGHLRQGSLPMQCALGDQSCVQDSVVRFQVLNDPDLTILGHGQRTAGTVSVSGGSDALQYAVNADYSDELGLVELPSLEVDRYRVQHGNVDPPSWMRHPQQFRQWGLASRLTTKLGQQADLSLTAQFQRSFQQRSSLESQIPSLVGTYVDKASGTYYRTNFAHQLSTDDAILSDYYTHVTDEANRFTNAASLNWRPRSWLTFTADGGLDVLQREDESLLPRNAVLAAADSVGRVANGRGTSLVGTANARATLMAPLPFGARLTTAIGGNFTDSQTSDVSVFASDLAAGSSSLTGAGQIDHGAESRLEQRTFGWYIEPAINTRRFWLSTGLRLDGGNTFGSNVKLAAFPKISASYLISDEPFFPFKSVFNTLRLRATYGHAGVQPGPGDRLRLYGQPSQVWVDGHFVDGISLSTLGNTELKPERSEEIEGGFDADLLNDRVSLGVTAYRKMRVDALMQVPIPPSVYGNTTKSILRNVGTIRNAGWELSLGGQLVRSDLLTWGAQLQMSHNENVVESLGPGVLPFGHDDSRIVEGYPLGGRWGVPVRGYADTNGDGVLEDTEVLYGDSLVYLGSPEPDYTASLSTTVTLFHAALAVTAGFTYENGMSQFGSWSNLVAVSRGVNDPTSSLAEQAAMFRPTLVGDYMNTQVVNVLRFNSLSVTYRVPTALARRIGTRSLAVSLQGMNLGLHTNYRGIDPDVNGNPTGNGVTDPFVLPQPRSWQVRVSASY